MVREVCSHSVRERVCVACGTETCGPCSRMGDNWVIRCKACFQPDLHDHSDDPFIIDDPTEE